MFIAWLVAVDAFILLTKSWYDVLLLWFVPGITVQVAIFRIRALAEHYGIEAEHELNQTRTVIPTWWERLLICPCGVNYHLEHHLFPSVPYCCRSRKFRPAPT